MQVDDTLKELYKSDSIEKNLFIEFYHPEDDNPFLILGGDGRLVGESMKITEALSSSENLDFGSCEATQLEITVIDVDTDIIGATMRVYQVIEGMEEYTMPLGTYIVQTAPRQTNGRYRDVLALDKMSLFDVNVIEWYNSLEFPMTLKAFRASLCEYIGVTEEIPDYLPNDSMQVEKTIDAPELIGRDVLIACEQINGAFGHFDRNGILQHMVIEPNMMLYPSEVLFPSEDLYPGAIEGGNPDNYEEVLEPYLNISCRAEEYTVQPITAVHIRQEEGDIGAIYGDGTNCYIVEGNFLVYGKTAAELEEIAANIYSMISDFEYVPFEYRGKGLPYLEVGSSVWLQKEGVPSYIMKRTLTGTSALKDEYSATGEEVRSTESNVNTEIIQLKGRAAVLKKTVEEVSVSVTDLKKATEAQFKVTAESIKSEVTRAEKAESNLSSRITQTAELITAEVTRAKGAEVALSSRITQQAGLIELKVSKGNVSSQLSIETDQITISGNRLVVSSDNFKVSKTGNVTITGDAEISGNITGSTITGSVFESDTFYADDDEVRIGDFSVSTDNTGRFTSSDGNFMFETAATPSGVQFKFGGVTYTNGVLGNVGRISGSYFQGLDEKISEMYDIELGKSWWHVSVTERVHYLEDCLWALASIIDEQWTDWSGVESALDDYYYDNRPW